MYIQSFVFWKRKSFERISFFKSYLKTLYFFVITNMKHYSFFCRGTIQTGKFGYNCFLKMSKQINSNRITRPTAPGLLVKMSFISFHAQQLTLSLKSNVPRRDIFIGITVLKRTLSYSVHFTHPHILRKPLACLKLVSFRSHLQNTRFIEGKRKTFCWRTACALTGFYKIFVITGIFPFRLQPRSFGA